MGKRTLSARTLALNRVRAKKWAEENAEYVRVTAAAYRQTKAYKTWCAAYRAKHRRQLRVYNRIKQRESRARRAAASHIA